MAEDLKIGNSEQSEILVKLGQNLQENIRTQSENKGNLNKIVTINIKVIKIFFNDDFKYTLFI